MTFTTEALQASGLNDEQVKGIMVEYCKDVNELKENVEQL